MSAFAIGAKWKVLDPKIEVAEPINENFPEARAPTVDEAEARKVPVPRPKQSFAEQFDRPVFRRLKKRHNALCSQFI